MSGGRRQCEQRLSLVMKFTIPVLELCSILFSYDLCLLSVTGNQEPVTAEVVTLVHSAGRKCPKHGLLPRCSSANAPVVLAALWCDDTDEIGGEHGTIGARV